MDDFSIKSPFIDDFPMKTLRFSEISPCPKTPLFLGRTGEEVAGIHRPQLRAGASLRCSHGSTMHLGFNGFTPNYYPLAI